MASRTSRLKASPRQPSVSQSPRRTIKEDPASAAAARSGKPRRAARRDSLDAGGGRTEFNALVQKLFDLADVSHTGAILFGDFLAHHEKFMDVAETLPTMNYVETEKNFKALDKDHNGHLDREEFGAYMESMMAILGGRSFKSICECLIQQETQHLAAAKAGFDWKFSERLLEQARTTNHYRPEVKEAAMKFLEQRADPNHVDSTGSSALMHAVEKADAAFIRKLLKFRANPMLHNKEMECAAFLAARARKEDVLTLLFLPESEEVGEGSQDERERLSTDLIRNMSQLTGAEIDGLLSRRADINHRDEFGWTPLTAAVSFGKQESLEALLRAQAASPGKVRLRIDSRNGKGRAALHLAARKGHPSIVKLLLSARSVLDVQDTEGWTPLHHAAFNGRNEVIEVLMQASADLLVKARNGLTPYLVTKLPSRAGELTEKSLNLLKPSEHIDYSKSIAPVLRAQSTVYDKLEVLLGLPGVCRNPKNLRLHEQFFDPRLGPNKIRLRKTWDVLIRPLMLRLQTGMTDLEELGEHFSEDERINRKIEIETRQEEQKQFVQEWLLATKGLRPTKDWQHENRGCFIEELQDVVETLFSGFEIVMQKLYQKMQEQDGADDLCAMQEEEVLRPDCCSQLSVHPIPLWLEQLDPAGAFEALRLVGAWGMGKSDGDSVMAFMDLINLSNDFDTGRSFWLNVYKMWLSEYARAADPEFHKTLRGIVEQFNLRYEETGLHATYRAGSVKSLERMKVKECEYGKPSPETFEGRILSARILDIIRGFITVNCPRAALVLIDEFFRPLVTGRLRLARIINRFSESAATLKGYRNIVMNVLYNGGLQSGRCGRPGSSMHLLLVGEVQVNLDSFFVAQKQRHLVLQYSRGEFDWSPSEANIVDDSTLLDDDDMPHSAAH